MAERRAPRGVLLTLGLLAAITAVALAVAQDQETRKLRSSFSAEDPRSADYLAALVGADLTHGNTCEVLTDGDQIFPAMLDAIDHARRRISLETYLYEQGKVAEAFTRALEDAARGDTVTPCWTTGRSRRAPMPRRSRSGARQPVAATR